MDTKFTKTQDTVFNGIVRHILTAAGGALVARDSLAESELELAVCAIITLTGVIWSALPSGKRSDHRTAGWTSRSYTKMVKNSHFQLKLSI